MKMKKKAAIAAAVFAAAMNFSACDNYASGVYGPPNEDFEENYDPSYNQNANVYGPPEEEYEDATQTEEITSFDPAENQTVGVYGSPAETWEQEETDTPEEEQEVGEDTLKNE